MLKKFFVSIVISILLLVFVFLIVYVIFNSLIMKSELSNVEVYKLKKNEEINKTFKYNKYNYVVTSYYEDGKDYAQNNFLIKYNNKFYYLDSYTDCDMSSYVKDNFMYVHCIGYSGNVTKFKFYGTKVFNEVIELSYKDAPNVKQSHLNVEKVTDKYIYLTSNVKKDENVKEGNKVKCSLKDTKCVYAK